MWDTSPAALPTIVVNATVFAGVSPLPVPLLPPHAVTDNATTIAEARPRERRGEELARS
jgi:hypothetical protein